MPSLNRFRSLCVVQETGPISAEVICCQIAAFFANRANANTPRANTSFPNLSAIPTTCYCLASCAIGATIISRERLKLQFSIPHFSRKHATEPGSQTNEETFRRLTSCRILRRFTCNLPLRPVANDQSMPRMAWTINLSLTQSLAESIFRSYFRFRNYLLAVCLHDFSPRWLSKHGQRKSSIQTVT